MRFKATTAFYIGDEYIETGTVVDIDEDTAMRCIKAKVGFVIEEGGDNGAEAGNTSGTGTGDAGRGKAASKGGRK
jgi:hypothetical protein